MEYIRQIIIIKNIYIIIRLASVGLTQARSNNCLLAQSFWGQKTRVVVPDRNQTFGCLIQPCHRIPNCSAKPPLWAGLICTAKMNEYLESLCSVYKPRP